MRSPPLRFLRATASSAGQPHGRAFARLGSRLLLVAVACGPSLGGDVARAGWIARRALMHLFGEGVMMRRVC